MLFRSILISFFLSIANSYAALLGGHLINGPRNILYTVNGDAASGVASMDKTGKIQDREESGNLKDIFRRYAMLQYNQVFDKKNHMEDFFLLNK